MELLKNLIIKKSFCSTIKLILNIILKVYKANKIFVIFLKTTTGKAIIYSLVASRLTIGHWESE